MAKSPMPMMQTGGSGVLPKVFSALVAAAALVLVVKHPVEAAQWLGSVLTVLEGAVEGLATFLQHVLV